MLCALSRYYISPKSYMDLISLYISLLKEKQAEYCEAYDRLSNGLNKLQETNAVVDTMQIQLNELQPILEEKAQVRHRHAFTVQQCRPRPPTPSDLQPD